MACEIAAALREIGTSNGELETFLYAAIMSDITVEPLKNDPKINFPVVHLKSD